MISAVDTNVLLDIFQADPRYASRSMQWIRDARKKGSIIVCDVVYGELVKGFSNEIKLYFGLRNLGINCSSIDKRIAYEAGRSWMSYRKRGGPRGLRGLPDFLIGAHAMIEADTLLTRDPKFYKTNFPHLSIAK